MENFSIDLTTLNIVECPSAKIKIDELFLEWLCLDDTKKIIELLLLEPTEKSMDHKTLDFPSPPLDDNITPPLSPQSLRSPKKRSQAEMQQSVTSKRDDSNNSISTPSSDGPDLQVSRRRSNMDSIPMFYVPGRARRSRKPIAEDQLSLKLNEIESYFKAYPAGIPYENFVHITKGLCGLPSFFNLPFCKRLNFLYGNVDKSSTTTKSKPLSSSSSSNSFKITLKSFLAFWKYEMEPYDRYERFFNLVKSPTGGVDYICKDDFVPYVQELLHFHPGLEFLENHDEFQRKYALTVIARIFYGVNLSRSGKLSLRELMSSNLLVEFMHVDEETDINKVTEYFSYEHFYVLYCRFFELDADKDSKLTKEDILRYGDHSLSEAIVDRIFQVGCRAFTDGREGAFRQTGMTYSDFIYFMLAEEDKASDAAISYWFMCCDLDGDGVLTTEEMRYFYRSQLQRTLSLGQEPINFGDVLCQLVDMISPADPIALTLQDMTKPAKRSFSGVLFDVLFNLNKFMRFESRDPFQEKQKREDSFHNDWNRFAHVEYHRLAAEEEGYDDSMEVVDGSEEGRSYGEAGGGASAGGGEYHSAGGGGGQAHWSMTDSDSDDDRLIGVGSSSSSSSKSKGGGSKSSK